MADAIRILGLEPYYGGARAAFLDGLRARSRHRWTLLVMPARKWEWRMRGAALHLAKEAGGLARQAFDLVLATDSLALADWRALAPPSLAAAPAVTYFHENQVVPALSGERRSAEFAFRNLTACLAAHQVWFNSAYHREGFLAATEALLGRMPDFVPAGLAAAIGRKSRVLPPGADLAPLAAARTDKRFPEAFPRRRPLIILWNHRWEPESDPEAFFQVLFDLARQGAPFRLAVVGEAHRKWPPVFDEARRRLGDRLVRFGYLPDRRDYEAQVRAADIVVSTAASEPFGLAVVEAVAAGCFPLVPHRLSYPEIVPAELRATFLYKDEHELRVKLARLLAGKGPWDRLETLADHVRRYDWANLAPAYDDALADAARA